MSGGYYRGDDGQSFMHLNFGSGRKPAPSPCAAPCLPTDDAKLFGGRCGRIAGSLCDGPARGREGTCDLPICRRHRIHVEPDTDYCLTCAEALDPKGLGA